MDIILIIQGYLYLLTSQLTNSYLQSSKLAELTSTLRTNDMDGLIQIIWINSHLI